MPLAVEVSLLTANHISSKHLFIFVKKEDWSFANFTNIVFFFQSNLFPKVYFSQVVRLQIGSKLFNKVSLSFCPGKVFRPNSEKFSPPSDLTLGLAGWVNNEQRVAEKLSQQSKSFLWKICKNNILQSKSWVNVVFWLQFCNILGVVWTNIGFVCGVTKTVDKKE